MKSIFAVLFLCAAFSASAADPALLSAAKAAEPAVVQTLKAQAIYAEMDGRPLMLVPGTGGGTDAGFASLSGKAVVLESFGLAGWGYHARDECIEIDSIVPRLYLMTRMLVDLGKN